MALSLPADRTNIAALAASFKTIAAILEDSFRQPHGTPASPDDVKVAKHACVKLCGGNTQFAGTLWAEIEGKLGYMPHAAAVALVHASDTTNLVPHIEAPVPQ